MRSHCVAIVNELYCQESADVEIVVEVSNEADDEHLNIDSVEKRRKYDPLAEFHNSSSSDGMQPHSPKSSKDRIAEIDEEMRHYMAISGAILKQQNAVRSIFDPLLWWGKQRYSFPIISYVAKIILVISASSAESERHFSSAGHIARKHHNRLKDDAVESCVLYYEALRKGILHN